MAFGISASIAIASWFGFDPKVSDHPPGVYWGLTLCMGVLPILFNLVAIFCLYKITINSQRHDVIRRRLDARENRVCSPALDNQNP